MRTHRVPRMLHKRGTLHCYMRIRHIQKSSILTLYMRSLFQQCQRSSGKFPVGHLHRRRVHRESLHRRSGHGLKTQSLQRKVSQGNGNRSCRQTKRNPCHPSLRESPNPRQKFRAVSKKNEDELKLVATRGVYRKQARENLLYEQVSGMPWKYRRVRKHVPEVYIVFTLRCHFNRHYRKYSAQLVPLSGVNVHQTTVKVVMTNYHATLQFSRNSSSGFWKLV